MPRHTPETAVAAWQDKIVAKLVDLQTEDVKISPLPGLKLPEQDAGEKVRIVQSMILNGSKPGTPCNQFPARIPVDAKPASEAAYNRLSQTKS